ncbi:hypothetical protein [Blattabacterium cuenoti]|uniref:hypothetical protein n=1 Tax=Blattabacterium cuenoti TaxID=1653831 RepID=UPI00311E01CF
MRKKIYRSTLVASIKRPVEINFLERKLISTGLFIYENTRCSFFLKKNDRIYLMSSNFFIKKMMIE